MWWTPIEERAIRGEEWALFREGLSSLWDVIEDEISLDCEWETGVEVFDRLPPTQRLALLALVGTALTDDRPSSRLTAFNEGTVAAVYASIRSRLEEEIEIEAGRKRDGESASSICFWRQLVLAAWRESGEPWEGRLPSAKSKNLETWAILVDCLACRILWDDGDYELGAHFLDIDPSFGHAKMREFGIDPDYFVDIPPDPTDAQLAEIRNVLRKLTGRVKAG